MTVTALALDDGLPRCVDCRTPLPEPTDTSPAERRCESCWWPHQATLPVVERAPLAQGYFEKRPDRLG